jgi:regulatory protein
MTNNNDENESKIIRHTITQLLSRREHGFQELLQKLSAKGFPKDDVFPVLSQFKDAELQCDTRFADMHLRSAISKGQGYKRIQETLRQLGVAEEYTQAVLQESEIDWFDLALQVKQKKFGSQIASDPKVILKQQRFLLYRGFSLEQVKHALTTEGES